MYVCAWASVVEANGSVERPPPSRHREFTSRISRVATPAPSDESTSIKTMTLLVQLWVVLDASPQPGLNVLDREPRPTSAAGMWDAWGRSGLQDLAKACVRKYH